jgi:8-oxo-dGTP diphosphatase
MTDFVGAKVALICGDAVLTYLRDDRPGLPWPAHWDLPGGGREGAESAEQCLFREVMEEFALPLTPAHLTWRASFPALHSPGHHAIFFAGHITASEVSAIRFGDEGQTWQMMPLAQWLTHPRAVPDLPRRTEIALRDLAR